MTSSSGTNPRVAGLVARERLEQRGVNTLSDAGLLTILAALNSGRTADAVLDECEAVQALPQESAGDPAVATILTTAHDITRITVAFTVGRISTAHATAAAARVTSPSSSVKTPS